MQRTCNGCGAVHEGNNCPTCGQASEYDPRTSSWEYAGAYVAAIIIFIVLLTGAVAAFGVFALACKWCVSVLNS